MYVNHGFMETTGISWFKFNMGLMSVMISYIYDHGRDKNLWCVCL